MKIKQFQMLGKEWAVLGTCAGDMQKSHFDHKTEGYNYAWVLMDGEGMEDDHIELLELAPDGSSKICERSFVVARECCPICGCDMHPHYDAGHNPQSWQECTGCGYQMDLKFCDEADVQSAEKRM